MDEIEITRLNIARYRRLLQTEVDEAIRRVIQKMLAEFEVKLASLKPPHR